MKKHHKSQLALPLSWRYSQTKNNLKTIELNKRVKWIYSATLSNFDEIFRSDLYFNKTTKNEVIIRGCNKKIVDFLLSLKFQSILIGKEAILELDKELFTRRSLKEMVNRGRKNGFAKEIEYSDKTKKLLQDFKKQTSHANEPQLEHFFIDEFSADTRLFIFQDRKLNWLAAVLVSKNSKSKIHTELLLRKKNAPNGVMEALLYKIYLQLKKEGIKEWSLGEVPFIVDDKMNFRFFSLQGLVIRVGRNLKFAYNYQGLYFFKKKFASRWDDLYLCVSPKVKLKHFVLLSFKSNIASLALYKLFK